MQQICFRKKMGGMQGHFLSFNIGFSNDVYKFRVIFF